MNIKRVLFSIILILLTNSFSFSQKVKLRGVVLDASTQKPLPYANVGFRNTYIGTVTDFEGKFELYIEKSLLSNDLFVSSVGYEKQSIKINKGDVTKNITVMLRPVDYKIEEVVVVDKSLRQRKIIKNAVLAIADNYYGSAFNYDFELSYDIDSLNLSPVLRLYDSQGYVASNIYDAFVSRNYAILEPDTLFVPHNLHEAEINLDDLLNSDIVRSQTGVLDISHLKDFELSEPKKDILGEDSVWVIEYVCKNPSLSVTYTYYATAYYGKIYINMKNYAVISNEYTIEAPRQSVLGVSYACNVLLHEVKNHFSVVYEKKNDFYFVKQLTCRQTFIDNNGNKHEKRISLKTKKVITDDVKKINNRQYYINMPVVSK